MMGSGMMEMMESGGMGGHRDLMEPGPMLRMLKTELALSEGQEKPLKDILYQVAKAHIKQRAMCASPSSSCSNCSRQTPSRWARSRPR
jgi:hypothetical protein